MGIGAYRQHKVEVPILSLPVASQVASWVAADDAVAMVEDIVAIVVPAEVVALAELGLSWGSAHSSEVLPSLTDQNVGTHMWTPWE